MMRNLPLISITCHLHNQHNNELSSDKVFCNSSDELCIDFCTESEGF